MKKATNNNLSDSWIISPLSKVIIALESGSRPKGGVKHITDGIPSLGAEHLDKNGTFNLTNIRYVPEDFAIRMTRGSIMKGDILVVKDGATTGKTSLIRESFPYKRAVINEHVFLCRCNEDVMPDYIFYYLFSSNGNQQILKDFRGAAQGGISQRFADLVMVPLAPYDVQKLIVSEIEKQFSRLDEAVAALKRVRAGLKRYKVAVLKAAVEGRLTEEWRKQNVGAVPCACPDPNKGQPKVEGQPQGVAPTETGADLPDGWQCTKLAEVAEINPKLPKNIPDNVEVSFLPMKLVQEETGKIDLSITKKFGEVKKGYTSFINNDIIFAKITPCMENGKIAIVENLKNSLGFGSTEFHVIRLHEPKSIKYLFYFLLQRDIRKQAQRNMTGTAGQLRVPAKFMREISVSLPPISEQQKIVEEIESRLSVTEEIEEAIDINLKRAERLRQAILKKAFSGRLV